jgi:DnaK suppressor protein
MHRKSNRSDRAAHAGKRIIDQKNGFNGGKPKSRNNIRNSLHGKPERSEKNNKKNRYSDKELAEFKDIIDSKLASERKDLKYFQDQINNTAEQNGGHRGGVGADEAQGTEAVEYLSNMVDRKVQYIDKLEKALIRISNKSFGICKVTGELINLMRLRAVPTTTQSIEAKNAAMSS